MPLCVWGACKYPTGDGRMSVRRVLNRFFCLKEMVGGTSDDTLEYRKKNQVFHRIFSTEPAPTF